MGFGGGCDKELLEEIRKCGNLEGTFRYAEPGDDNDALCNKITNLFDYISKFCTIPMSLIINDNDPIPINFPID